VLKSSESYLSEWPAAGWSAWLDPVRWPDHLDRKQHPAQSLAAKSNKSKGKSTEGKSDENNSYYS
jgi:hypothetical protein